MSKKIIKENEFSIMYHHTGWTKFRGCQCYRDCSCYEDFKPVRYDYYTVVRKYKKATRYETLEEADDRWPYLLLLSQAT